MLYEWNVDCRKFLAVEPVDENDDDLFIDGFNGVPMAHAWSAPAVGFVDDPSSAAQLQGDFPHLFGAVPIMSEKAVAALRSLLEPNGELLPLSSEDGTYWAYNCLTVVDAMDTQRSTADYLAPDRIVVLRHFVPRDVELAPIFKLPQWLCGSALVTEQFVELVVRHGLTGLDLRPLTEL